MYCFPGWGSRFAYRSCSTRWRPPGSSGRYFSFVCLPPALLHSHLVEIWNKNAISTLCVPEKDAVHHFSRETPAACLATNDEQVKPSCGYCSLSAHCRTLQRWQSFKLLAWIAWSQLVSWVHQFIYRVGQQRTATAIHRGEFATILGTCSGSTQPWKRPKFTRTFHRR